MFYDVFGAKVERETFAKELTSHAANNIFGFVCVRVLYVSQPITVK